MGNKNGKNEDVSRTSPTSSGKTNGISTISSSTETESPKPKKRGPVQDSKRPEANPNHRFYCDACPYSTNRIGNWNKHLITDRCVRNRQEKPLLSK